MTKVTFTSLFASLVESVKQVVVTADCIPSRDESIVLEVQKFIDKLSHTQKTELSDKAYELLLCDDFEFAGKEGVYTGEEIAVIIMLFTNEELVSMETSLALESNHIFIPAWEQLEDNSPDWFAKEFHKSVSNDQEFTFLVSLSVSETTETYSHAIYITDDQETLNQASFRIAQAFMGGEADFDQHNFKSDNGLTVDIHDTKAITPDEAATLKRLLSVREYNGLDSINAHSEADELYRDYYNLDEE